MPKMKHPDSSQVIEVSPAQVQLYVSQGWKKHTPKSSAAKSTPTATDATKKE